MMPNRLEGSDQTNQLNPQAGGLDHQHVYSDIFPPVPTGTGKGGRQPVIVLDPGHSGHDIKDKDPKTALNDHDYPNFPEINECWDVTQRVADKLRKDGYKVVLTKDSALGDASLRQRADIARNANADLAVSIHDDHGKKYGDFAEVFEQRDGEWRGGLEQSKVFFDNPAVAQASHEAAKNFIEERERAEGHDPGAVKLVENSFDGRPGIDPGTISQVQLYAGEGPKPESWTHEQNGGIGRGNYQDGGPHAVPWVYNEIGGIGDGPNQGLSKEQEARYADGLVAAIEKSVPRGTN